MAKLDIKACGLAAGILWALLMFLLGLGAVLFDWGRILVSVLGSMYIGYSSTFSGIIIGTLWGFVDGAVCGVIFAWVYNKVSK